MYIILFLILIFIFAVFKENREQWDSYKKSMPFSQDSTKILYTKLSDLLKTDNRIIKWRRSFILSVIITILIFSIIYFRIPSEKEIVLFVFIIYSSIYVGWQNLVAIISDKVEIIGNNIIRIIKRKNKNNK